MKIIFICGSIEPGKDGVGDYTRRLCGELINKGLSVGILAFNDSYITKVTEEKQYSDSHAIQCLRLPKIQNSKLRCDLAMRWVKKHDPEWLSLQFVPYAFHHKGLPFKLAKQLKRMSGHNTKWHIMFHELWIGMSQQSSRKEILIGYVQKKIIKDLVLKINPKVINTQTQLYKKQLIQLGFNVSILPLFSNIPLNNEFENNELPINLKTKYFVLFGAIHHGAPIESFCEELAAYAKEKPLTLVTIGRNGSELNHWISVFRTNGLKIINLGEQSQKVISGIFKKAIFGISTTPILLVEKSGSVAAMQEHSLPVICMSRPWSPLGVNKESFILEGITEYKEGKLAESLKFIRKVNPEKNNLTHVVFNFINNLKLN